MTYINNLKLSNNIDEIEREVNNKKFLIDLSDHILHIKNFISKEDCNKVVEFLKKENYSDKSTPYTDGLLNDKTDSWFNPKLEIIDEIKNKVFNDGLYLYSKKIRSFNWSYFESEKFFSSEIIIRKYNKNSEFKYHYDDIIEQIFPHWFKRRRNILTCNIYLNDPNEYEGGELYFPSCDRLYKPSIGDIIISPSNWMFFHKVKEIISGTRYSGTFWFYFGSDSQIKKGKGHEEIFSK